MQKFFRYFLLDRFSMLDAAAILILPHCFDSSPYKPLWVVLTWLFLIPVFFHLQRMAGIIAMTPEKRHNIVMLADEIVKAQPKR